MPPWFLDGDRWGEEGPELHLDSLAVRVLVLRNCSLSLFENLVATNGALLESVKKLACDAEAIDLDLSNWVRSLPEGWRFTAQTLPGLQEMFPVHSYASVGHAAIWNRFRALRLITNSIHGRSMSVLTSL